MINLLSLLYILLVFFVYFSSSFRSYNNNFFLNKNPLRNSKISINSYRQKNNINYSKFSSSFTSTSFSSTSLISSSLNSLTENLPSTFNEASIAETLSESPLITDTLSFSPSLSLTLSPSLKDSNKFSSLASSLSSSSSSSLSSSSTSSISSNISNYFINFFTFLLNLCIKINTNLIYLYPKYLLFLILYKVLLNYNIFHNIFSFINNKFFSSLFPTSSSSSSSSSSSTSSSSSSSSVSSSFTSPSSISSSFSSSSFSNSYFDKLNKFIDNFLNNFYKLLTLNYFLKIIFNFLNLNYLYYFIKNLIFVHYFFYSLYYFNNNFFYYILYNFLLKFNNLFNNSSSINRYNYIIKKLLNINIFLFYTIFLLNIITNFYNISLLTILKFGGLSGILIGLSVKDIFLNFLSGLFLLIFEPFQPGDKITFFYSNSYYIGVVERLGWFQTQLRGRDTRLSYIPNNIFLNLIITNCDRITHRKFNLCVPIRYSDHTKIQELTTKIKERLRTIPKLDALAMPFRVSLARIGSLALEIDVSCHFATKSLDEFLSLQQAATLEILDTIKSVGASLMLPIPQVESTDGGLKDVIAISAIADKVKINSEIKE